MRLRRRPNSRRRSSARCWWRRGEWLLRWRTKKFHAGQPTSAFSLIFTAGQPKTDPSLRASCPPCLPSLPLPLPAPSAPVRCTPSSCLPSSPDANGCRQLSCLPLVFFFLFFLLLFVSQTPFRRAC